MMRKLPDFREQVLSNATYKVVALAASLVLWFTVLGRKDVVAVRDFNIEFLVKPHHIVVAESADRVKVKVVGSSLALKRFNSMDDIFFVDLMENGPGEYSVRLPMHGSIELPVGVRLLSIHPGKVQVKIKSEK